MRRNRRHPEGRAIRVKAEVRPRRKYRNAILMGIDPNRSIRLSTDHLTQKEIKRTADELGNVILGRPSLAADLRSERMGRS